MDEEQSSPTVASVGERRVLLIEDDPETNRLFVEILAEDGFTVMACAHDDLPARDGASLVITDLDRGSRKYSAGAAADWVRMLRARYGAPVFVITGHAEAARDEALLTEVLGVMSKPIDIDDLVTRLETAFESVLH